MENVEKKRRLLLFISIFLMILSVNFFCISQKRGVYRDEQMSICYANAIPASNSFHEEYIPEGFYTGKQLKQTYLWNDSSIKDVFHDLKYLYLENADKYSTNLYYSILRIWFSGVDFNDIDYFILKGCLLNIVFFCFAFFFMYKLLALLFDNDKLSVGLGLIVAFLNTGTLTNLIFIREYYLQMTMFIILSYFVVKNITNYNNATHKITTKNLCVTSFITALTLLSGYYSIFFILFLYLWMSYKPLKNKDYTFLKHIGKTFGLSILFTVIIYPLYFINFFKEHCFVNILLEPNFISYLSYLYNNLLYHLGYFIYYLPVLLFCFIMLFLPNKKAENDINKPRLNSLILPLLSFGFCILVILLQQIPFTDYRCIVATYPLLALAIPYLCDKKEFKAICSSLLIIIYLYAAFVSPANSGEAQRKFHYALKRFTYIEDRNIIDKIQTYNLPILIYENCLSCRKYIYLSYLKDKNIFYTDNANLIPKGQDFILLVYSDKKGVNRPFPEFLKDKTPNIIFYETTLVGYILTKD